MPKANRPGQLRERLTFQRRGEGGGQYSDSGPSGAFEDLTELVGVPAAVRPIRGSEKILSDRLQGVVIYELLIRESDAAKAIKASDRAVNDVTGEVYNIGHAPVNPDTKGRWLTMQAELGSDDG